MSLIEVLIGAAIVATAIVATVLSFRLLLAAGAENLERVQASYLAEEGIEVVRGMRDEDWSAFAGLTSGTTYYLHYDGMSWSINTTATSTDGFTRTVRLRDVYRRTSDSDIVPATSTAPKAVDTQTRFVTVAVTWNSSRFGVRTIELSSYLTNLFTSP